MFSPPFPLSPRTATPASFHPSPGNNWNLSSTLCSNSKPYLIVKLYVAREKLNMECFDVGVLVLKPLRKRGRVGLWGLVPYFDLRICHIRLVYWRVFDLLAPPCMPFAVLSCHALRVLAVWDSRELQSWCSEPSSISDSKAWCRAHMEIFRLRDSGWSLKCASTFSRPTFYHMFNFWCLERIIYFIPSWMGLLRCKTAESLLSRDGGAENQSGYPARSRCEILLEHRVNLTARFGWRFRPCNQGSQR